MEIPERLKEGREERSGLAPLLWLSGLADLPSQAPDSDAFVLTMTQVTSDRFKRLVDLMWASVQRFVRVRPHVCFGHTARFSHVGISFAYREHGSDEADRRYSRWVAECNASVHTQVGFKDDLRSGRPVP